ncbi:MAG: hypothetical protein H7263_16005, partial [Candidatus Sericytochromatia bacterium]|nr:hypothetical protein [Candidatus Sericytochromatia bacterium]
MNLSNKKKINLFSNIAIVLAFLISIFSYLSINNLVSDIKIVFNTNSILKELNQIKQTVNDCKDFEKLEKFSDDDKRLYIKNNGLILIELDKFKNIEYSNSINLSSQDRLSSLIKKKLKYMDDIIKNHQLNIEYLSKSTSFKKDENKINDQIYIFIEQIKIEVEALIEKRQQEANKNAKIALYVIFLGTLVTLFIILFSLRVITSDLIKHKKLEAEIEDSRDELDFILENIGAAVWSLSSD